MGARSSQLFTSITSLFARAVPARVSASAQALGGGYMVRSTSHVTSSIDPSPTPLPFHHISLESPLIARAMSSTGPALQAPADMATAVAEHRAGAAATRSPGSASVQAQLQSFSNYFSSFLRGLSAEKKAALGIPDNACSLSDVISVTKGPSFEVTIGYITFYAEAAEGVDDDGVKASTVTTHPQTFLFACSLLSETPLDPEVTRKARRHVDEKLIPELGLSEEKRPPTWTDDSIVEHVIRTTFSPGAFEANTRRRFETLLYISSSFDSAQRACEFVGKEVKAGWDLDELERLTWSRVTVVHRRSDGDQNELFSASL